eukprot:CAMPEP_0202882510 /NCGR_PEP_ID=MMETSP1391-20130828/38095_1 /ASSEMBLY_ACC=CAM_ASM_000867 /TAXON_ID=1034604 /ORGANISM="Chlamydomonas leiostraca, Strain SAG 11-49" /LENGTH=70 /DNA_ID=CAMNT_0049565379 /DNA_START=1153 /DNA_END=1365 /DNA_ORIENTATION=-
MTRIVRLPVLQVSLNPVQLMRVEWHHDMCEPRFAKAPNVKKHSNEEVGFELPTAATHCDVLTMRSLLFLV